ncbi:MAG: hypothetical protein ACREL7_09510 [Longimicrobiales bacterium]
MASALATVTGRSIAGGLAGCALGAAVVAVPLTVLAWLVAWLRPDGWKLIREWYVILGVAAAVLLAILWAASISISVLDRHRRSPPPSY